MVAVLIPGWDKDSPPTLLIPSWDELMDKWETLLLALPFELVIDEDKLIGTEVFLFIWGVPKVWNRFDFVFFSSPISDLWVHDFTAITEWLCVPSDLLPFRSTSDWLFHSLFWGEGGVVVADLLFRDEVSLERRAEYGDASVLLTKTPDRNERRFDWDFGGGGRGFLKSNTEPFWPECLEWLCLDGFEVLR